MAKSETYKPKWKIPALQLSLAITAGILGIWGGLYYFGVIPKIPTAEAYFSVKDIVFLGDIAKHIVPVNGALFVDLFVVLIVAYPIWFIIHTWAENMCDPNHDGKLIARIGSIQWRVIDDWCRHWLITGATGCLGRGTKVILSSGETKAVEDIETGDVLMGDDGTIRNVLTLRRGKMNMYKIIPEIGTEWICNEVHIMTLLDEFGKRIDVPLNEFITWKNQSNYKLFQVNHRGQIEATYLWTYEKISKDNYYGFTLDGNGRFLIDNGIGNIVTHNTGKTATGIMTILHQLFRNEDGRKRKGEPNRPPWGGVFLDDKSVFYHKLVKLCKYYKREHNLKLLRIRLDTDPIDWQPSTKFNLLCFDSIPYDTYAEMIASTSDSLTKSGGEKGDPFFDGQAKIQIGQVIRFMRALRDYEVSIKGKRRPDRKFTQKINELKSRLVLAEHMMQLPDEVYEKDKESVETAFENLVKMKFIALDSCCNTIMEHEDALKQFAKSYAKLCEPYNVEAIVNEVVEKIEISYPQVEKLNELFQKIENEQIEIGDYHNMIEVVTRVLGDGVFKRNNVDKIYKDKMAFWKKEYYSPMLPLAEGNSKEALEKLCTNLRRDIDELRTEYAMNPSLLTAYQIISSKEFYLDLLNKLNLPISSLLGKNDRDDNLNKYPLELTSTVQHFDQYFKQPDGQLQGIQGSVQVMLSYFTTPIIADVFCEENTFNFSGMEMGDLICVAMPQAYSLHKRFINTIIKVMFFQYARNRFDDGLSIENKNILGMLNDEAQRNITRGDPDVDILREARCFALYATQSQTALLKGFPNEKEGQVFLSNLCNRIILKSGDKGKGSCAEKSAEYFQQEEFENEDYTYSARSPVSVRVSKKDEYIIRPLDLLKQGKFEAFVCHAEGELDKYVIAPLGTEGQLMKFISQSRIKWVGWLFKLGIRKEFYKIPFDRIPKYRQPKAFRLTFKKWMQATVVCTVASAVHFYFM
jgi:hypothetical protein